MPRRQIGYRTAISIALRTLVTTEKPVVITIAVAFASGQQRLQISNLLFKSFEVFWRWNRWRAVYSIIAKASYPLAQTACWNLFIAFSLLLAARDLVWSRLQSAAIYVDLERIGRSRTAASQDNEC